MDASEAASGTRPRLPHHAAGSPRKPAHRHRGAVAVAAVAVAAALLLGAGCSAGDSDPESSAADEGTAGAAAGAPADGVVAESAGTAASQGARTGGVGPGEQTAGVGLDEVAFAGRDVIRTGSLSLVAEDLVATRSRVTTVLNALGGVIASESTTVAPRRAAQEGEQTMLLGLQVPTDRFDAAVAELSELGTVRARSIQTEDVTGEVADVDSRVESARAALERVRALLTRADNLGTVIRLESVLSNRQSDLEALLARQRALAGQTSMASIQLELHTPEEREKPPPAEDEEELRGFVDGVSEGWDGLRTLMVAVSTAVGVVLPFALVGAVVATPVLVWRRRRNGSGTVTPSAT